MTDQIDTAKLRELRNAGTPGQWHPWPGSTSVGRQQYPHVTIADVDSTSSDDAYARCGYSNPNQTNDATLIVAAVNNLVPLCDALDAARERVRELEELVEDMRLRQHNPVWERVVVRAKKEPTDGE